MFCSVSAHSSRVFRFARTISASWQPLHTRSTSDFPAPSGNRSCIAATTPSDHAVANTPTTITLRLITVLSAASAGRADGERIQRAVVGAQIHVAVRDGDSREMIPLVDLIAARPELF